MVDKDILGLLSPLALDIALPAMIFADIVTKFDPAVNRFWYRMPLLWVVFTVFAFIVSILSSFIAKKEFKREMAVTMMYQNAIFFPLAIIASMYGSGSSMILQLFFFTFFNAAFIFNTAHLFFKTEKTSFDLKRTLHPTLVATVLAVLVKLFGFGRFIPTFATDSLRMVGSMSIPLLMIILGGNIFIDFKNKGKIHYFEIVKFVLIKNFLMPIAAIFILKFTNLPHDVSFIILLQAAVPPITATPILVERYGGNREIVNQFVLASFLASMLSIPLMIYLMNIIMY